MNVQNRSLNEHVLHYAVYYVNSSGTDRKIEALPMTLETLELEAIVERLGMLEKENRRLRRCMIIVIIAVSSVILMGQSKPLARIAEAQKFALKDASGNVRGWMGIVGKGSELILRNDSAQPMISLKVSTDAGDLHFYGRQSSGMNLGLDSASPSVAMAYADGQGSAGITFGKNGPSLRLVERNGFSTVVGASQINSPTAGRAPYTSAASVVLYDKNKKVIWKAP